jgi:uncharacterized membrane protein
MTDIANFINQHVGFHHFAFWATLGSLVLILWIGVRAFLDDGRLRRALSVAIPLVPVVLAALVIALDWHHVRRSFTFVRPVYLLLILGVVPAVIGFSIKSLAGLGPTRQVLAIVLRSAIVILLAAALAETQFVRFTERLTVLFLIDYSRSMPQDREAWLRDWVDRLIVKHKLPNDQAGVIFFAKQPRIEIPPLPYIELREPEGEYDRDHTDLGAALKLAQGAFPADTMKRIVIISDGNENRGEALRQAVAAKANGIAIDALPIRYRYDQEVMVEKITNPTDVHLGDTVNLNVIVRASAPVAGTLRIFQKASNRTTPLVEKDVELSRGVNAYSVPLKIEETNFYTYEARFQPADPTVDRIAANNDVSSFIYVKGTAQVLFIEGTAGEHDKLVEALRQENIEVIQVASDQVPDSLAELRPFDSVILANLPREALSDRQMEMIAANTHDLGSGLLMIGGPDSFGAGGFIDTPIEKAMPVDMQIKSMKVMGKGALLLVMHACEIPQGNFWEKQIAKDAIKTLSYNDEAGCIQSQGSPSWVFPLQQVRDKSHLYARIDRMTPMDMMDFDSVMVPARNSLMKSDAMTKHMIVVTDGDPAPTSPAVVTSLANAKITVTTVGVGVHGQDLMGQRHLANLAKQTGGRYYNVTNNKALPKIFQKEARIVSRPLIFEKEQGWQLNITHQSEPIAGIKELPPVKGLVLTQPKENELVEVPILSPLPGGTDNPLLAHWQYGLGKSVAFTSDAGTKWTNDWTGWDGYQKFWAQLVRWSMRSVASGNITVSTQRLDGKIKVVADVIDKENQFVNFAQIKGIVLDPDMQKRPIELTQVAPGRYEGTIDDAENRGTYWVTMDARVPGADPSRITTGVSVPYPQEYRELESNAGLLEQIVSLSKKAPDDTSSTVIPEEAAMRFDAAHNPFRHDMPPPTASEDIWHLLLFWAVILFFFDVATRRIALDPTQLRPAVALAWGYVRGRKVELASTDYMSKLRSRKVEVNQQLDAARAARRFEPATDDAPQTESEGPSVFDEPAGPAAGSARPRLTTQQQVTPEKPQEHETYTSRLLKAKQKVWDEKKN